MTQIGTRLYTLFFGTKVGEDGDGNCYYKRATTGYANARREKRWVIFAGEEEATSIPADWHAWIHHVTGDIPAKSLPAQKPWQKPHQENTSGTAEAYRPPGHFLKGGERDRARGDYEPWTPN